MTNYQRSGACAWCGQCCGANGDSPFPRPGWEAVRYWSLDDINESYPLYPLLGFGQGGDGQVGPQEINGNYKIKNKRYYYTWTSTGRGTQPYKDTSAAHDGSSYLPECPFLDDDPGDGSRPCALMGTGDDGAVRKYCRPELRPEPPPNYDIWPDYLVQQWQNDHPDCSYTFEEIVE